jgi:thioesterase domain-containing protein/acyl carrier protein
MRSRIQMDAPWISLIPFRSSVKPEATSSMIEVLTPIWRRVLQLPYIGVDDNFFDLGGDSSLALQLFSEIAQVCDRELPPVTIYQAPTIAALASLLEQPTTPRFPALVLLKAGAEKPPVFIAHGLGGSVIDFFQPVRHIKSDHPIYGMQARGIDGLDGPLERVEDMAQFHLDAIKKLQPRGPYVLVGYSLGGLVVLEMAQRLSANGEKVALLAMLDAYPHIRQLTLGQRLRLIARQARRGFHSLRNLSGSAPYQRPAGISFTPAMQRVRDSAYLALTRYQPRFYPGKIKFVRAEISSTFPDDPAAVWASLASEFELEKVPGDHLGIIATHYKNLASVLSRYLCEAFADPPSGDSEGRGTAVTSPREAS